MALPQVAKLKFALLSRGVFVGPRAETALTNGGQEPLFVRDYPTTNGITLRMPGDVYVNAPEAQSEGAAAAILEFDPIGSKYTLVFADQRVGVDRLPVPTYETHTDHRDLGAATHADRVRLSPVSGCLFRCGFCDSHLTQYRLREPRELLRALDVALRDPALPARHALISGGVPRPADTEQHTRTCERIIAESPVPTDVMLAPRDVHVVDRLVAAGVWGLSMNLEVFGERAARTLCPSKHTIGHAGYARAISRAVNLLGANGRVRSLLIAGLEPMEDTLAGVEFIASLGCDPVLSPFRPARGTPLASRSVPDPEWTEELYCRAYEIARAHDVQLGPRCVPCQHNTLTLPEPNGRPLPLVTPSERRP